MTSAMVITSDSSHSRNQTRATKPTSPPISSPLISATRTSFHSRIPALLAPTWPKARPRTIRVSTCTAALPPIPATTGISTARATISSMVASNWPITMAARNAVIRLMHSHTTRPRTARGTGENRSSSSSRPAAPSAWCSACSRMMSTTSSMVMRPRSTLPSSTTGADTQSWSENWRATSWADSSTCSDSSSSSISSLIGVAGSRVTRSCSATQPISWWRRLTTYRWSVCSGSSPRRRRKRSTTSTVVSARTVTTSGFISRPAVSSS